MWKQAIVVFLAALSCVSSQGITVECEFQLIDDFMYLCLLRGVVVLDDSQPVTVTGNHIEGRENSDVEGIGIVNSNMPFMIPELFAAFPNIYDYENYYSNLQEINIPDSVQPQVLLLEGNNITRIQNGAFRGHSQLFFIRIMQCNVQEIGENAFEGLDQLILLDLFDNRIQTLAPQTFQPSPELMFLDLSGNLLSRIEESLFATNTELLNIDLRHNQINEISPRFAANLMTNLRYINFFGNNCVQRGFTLMGPEDWDEMNDKLETCYNNFNGTSPIMKRITLEFTGNLILYDDSGNVIARV